MISTDEAGGAANLAAQQREVLLEQLLAAESEFTLLQSLGPDLELGEIERVTNICLNDNLGRWDLSRRHEERAKNVLERIQMIAERR